MSAYAYRHGRAIGEHKGGAERDAGSGIMPAHDRGHVVTASKQAGYGIAACVQHSAVGIGAQTDAAAERARINRHSVVGRTRDPAQAWIRTLVWIAVVTVKVRRAFAELFVIPRLSKPIVLCHRASQPRCIHADL